MSKKVIESQNEELGFEDSLELTAKNLREPSLYPDGPWDLICTGYSFKDDTNKEGSPVKVVNFRYQGFEPLDGVDPEAVDAGGYEGRTIFFKQTLSMPAAVAARDGTFARFIRFIEAHGYEVQEEDGVREMANAVKGMHIRGSIDSYERKDGTRENSIDYRSIARIE